jgi:hypothetical protein
MGHANVKNLSELTIKHVYAKGRVSIADLTAHAIKTDETIHASEGEYEDEWMLREIFGTLIDFYLHDHRYTPRGPATPVLEACDLTERQQEVLAQWLEDGEDFEAWDADMDNPDSEYNVFDSIKWRYAPGWRAHYPDIPLLEHYEN